MIAGLFSSFISSNLRSKKPKAPHEKYFEKIAFISGKSFDFQSSPGNCSQFFKIAWFFAVFKPDFGIDLFGSQQREEVAVLQTFQSKVCSISDANCVFQR